MGLGSIQREVVLNEALAPFPVLHLDVQESVTLTSEGVDLPQAQPELSCDTDKSIRLSAEVVHTYPGR